MTLERKEKISKIRSGESTSFFFVFTGSSATSIELNKKLRDFLCIDRRATHHHDDATLTDGR